MEGSMSHVLVGQVVVLAIIFAIVFMLFQEALRLAFKVLLPAAAILALAVWLGLLDETLVVGALDRIGREAIGVVQAVSSWIAAAITDSSAPKAP